jgi:hypothetical protein
MPTSKVLTISANQDITAEKNAGQRESKQCNSSLTLRSDPNTNNAFELISSTLFLSSVFSELRELGIVKC